MIPVECFRWDHGVQLIVRWRIGLIAELAGVGSQGDTVSFSNKQCLHDHHPVALLAEKQEQENDSNIPVDDVQDKNNIVPCLQIQI